MSRSSSPTLCHVGRLPPEDHVGETTAASFNVFELRKKYFL